jgi:copper(I)-binding protein
MPSIYPARSVALAISLGVLTLDPGLRATAQNYKAGDLLVTQPWTRATPGGAKVAGGYLTVTNGGKDSDRLIGGTLPGASRVEIHEMKVENGVMEMRPLTKGLEIKPGETVKLEPGGYHVMFMGMTTSLKQGEKLKGQLRFEKAGSVEVEYSVAPVGAPALPSHGH